MNIILLTVDDHAKQGVIAMEMEIKTMDDLVAELKDLLNNLREAIDHHFDCQTVGNILDLIIAKILHPFITQEQQQRLGNWFLSDSLFIPLISGDFNRKLTALTERLRIA
jgi:hypothetical protein